MKLINPNNDPVETFTIGDLTPGTLVKIFGCLPYDGHICLLSVNTLVSLTDARINWTWKSRDGTPDFKVVPLPAGSRIILEQE